MSPRTAPFTRRREFSVDGLRIVVFEAGAGEPCLFLHGYPQSHKSWSKVAAQMTSHRIVAPDWFGWGQSERSVMSAPTYEREVARIGMLLDSLGIKECNLVCHDYGGFIGLGFAISNAHRVRRLAVINSRAQGDFAPSSYVMFNLLAFIARLPWGEEIFSTLPMLGIHRRQLLGYVRNQSFSLAELNEYLEFLCDRAGRRWLGHLYRHFQATRRRELRAGLRSLCMPAAVIWGDRDPYSPLTIGLELSRLLPCAKFTRLSGVDHFSPEQSPDLVAAALLQLLSRRVYG